MKNKASRANILLDQYFEKLRVSCKHKFQRGRFGIPENGWETIEELKQWEKELWSSQDRKKDWDEIISATLKEIGLYNKEIDEYQQKYRKNLELFITLDFNGVYDANLPGLPRFRGEDKYLRNKRLFELSLIVYPKTGKKIKAKEVARRFQPGFTSDGEQMSDLSLAYVHRNFKSERKVNKWYREYGLYEKVDPGAAVRKIISRHKKKFSS